jgi:hypothetical protein
MVPLENVHESGGWRWDGASRRAYANDQAVLVMTATRSRQMRPMKIIVTRDRSSAEQQTGRGGKGDEVQARGGRQPERIRSAASRASGERSRSIRRCDQQ